MISINTLPIAYHCNSCKENFRNERLSSYPCKCPSCGEERTSSGFYKLPQHRFYKSPPGSYNLLNYEDKKCQFVFRSLNNKILNILTEPENYENFEFDSDNYLESVKDMIDNFDFYYMGYKEKLQKFYDEELLPFEKEHQLNHLKNKKEELLIELWKTNKEYQSVLEDLEELEANEE
jgi:hypothetical protein